MSEKSTDAFRTIGEMAEALGVRTHILRYWEEQFSMLSPLKRAGGRRLYRPEDVALLQTIHRLLHHEGYTVKGARKFLSSGAGGGGGAEAPAPVMTAVVTGAAPQFDMSALRAVRDRLSAALAVA
jgi:DNA-binding transcriptional MerR regulator